MVSPLPRTLMADNTSGNTSPVQVHEVHEGTREVGKSDFVELNPTEG